MIHLKSKKILLLILMTFIILGGLSFFLNNKCNLSSRIQANNNFKSNKIILRNKTSNNYIKDECILQDTACINQFLFELNKLKPIEDVRIRANQGFYEIHFLLNEKEKMEVHVTYTTYDGVIIETNNGNGFFKNDKIESLALYYLQTGTECK